MFTEDALRLNLLDVCDTINEAAGKDFARTELTTFLTEQKYYNRQTCNHLQQYILTYQCK